MSPDEPDPSPNGANSPDAAKQELAARPAAAPDDPPPVSAPAGHPQPAASESRPTEHELPPARWSARASLVFAVFATVLVCVWWSLLAIPRAREFAGVAEQTTGGSAEIKKEGDKQAEETQGGSGEIIFVLAAISVLVTVAAVGVRAMTYSVVQEAIEEEREKAAESRAEHEESAARAQQARKPLNDVKCEINAMPTQVETECNAQEQHFWKGVHLRATQRPDLFGTWETIKAREKAAKLTLKQLWGSAGVPDAKGVEKYITKQREETAKRAKAES